MALSFPLPTDSFFAGLRFRSCSLDLAEALAMSGKTAGGAVLTAGGGARLWRGTVELVPMYREEADAIMARLSVLREPGRFLFVHPFPLAAPRYDPTGSILGAAAPVIRVLASNNREMALGGLRAGYRLGQGEGLSFAYGSNPTRYAFHRIVSSEVVAGANGQTGLFEVTPQVRPGAVVGAAITLIRPFFKALIVPGSVAPGTAAGVTSTGISFDILQTLR